MADIFVSYTQSDKLWAHWIALELKKLGLQSRVHEWEIGPGHDFMEWMSERLANSDHVACVMSPEYLRAPFSKMERHAAFARAVRETPGFALIFVVKPCEVPPLFGHFSRCELVGLDEHASRQKIADFLRPRAPPESVPFPGPAKATPSVAGVADPGFSPLVVTAGKAGVGAPGSKTLSNIPFAIPKHFLGREAAMGAIDAALAGTGGRAAITAAVHGLRGVGKTTLAAAYAWEHRDAYRATWWVNAQSPQTMRADLVALGVALGWIAKDAPEAPALADVLWRLVDDGAGLLLVYDNAIDAKSVEPFLPRGGAARALVTSNFPAWRGVATPIELETWRPDVGGEFLVARAGRTGERAAAEALSAKLGGLPLAHEQAGAYCERLHVSFDEYARRFDAEPIRLLDDEKDAPGAYQRTVAKTFALGIAEAAKARPAAEPLLAYAALLAPEPIPLSLFRDGREALKFLPSASKRRGPSPPPLWGRVREGGSRLLKRWWPSPPPRPSPIEGTGVRGNFTHS